MLVFLKSQGLLFHCVPPDACSVCLCYGFQVLFWVGSSRTEEREQVLAHHLASAALVWCIPTVVRRSACQECALKYCSLLWKELILTLSCPWQTDALSQVTWLVILLLLSVTCQQWLLTEVLSAQNSLSSLELRDSSLCLLVSSEDHLTSDKGVSVCLGWIWTWNCIWLTCHSFCNLSNVELAFLTHVSWCC